MCSKKLLSFLRITHSYNVNAKLETWRKSDIFLKMKSNKFSSTYGKFQLWNYEIIHLHFLNRNCGRNHLTVINSARYFHTHRQLSGNSLNGKQNFLEVQLGDVTLEIPFIWLRDHCMSQKFYNHETEQKIPQSGLTTMDLFPLSVYYTDNQTAVSITWKDGHVSKFNLAWLADNFYPGKLISQSKRTHWNKEIILSEGLPTVKYEDHMNTESGLKKSLNNLLRYGFTLVVETPGSQLATQAVSERVSYIPESFLGKMWTVAADASRSDTAYTTQSLLAHTDNTQQSAPAGIIVFHCLEHIGSGGETLLVDGFNALDELKKTHPAALQILSTFAVPHKFKETASKESQGFHIYGISPLVTVHPSSVEYVCFRFNPYDRAPLNTIRPDDLAAFYEAYEKLSEIISNQENELWLKLTKGSVLLVDNWRVLHGRAAFDGNRVICGCYLPRDEWISKARLMGLL